MNCQSPRLTKTFPAVRTLERLFFRVNVAMVSQVILAPEGFAADIAGVGPLVSVSSLVDHHVVTFGELSMAEFADEPLLGAGAS